MTATNPLPFAIICDLDGTLAHLNGRSPYDASTCLDDGLNHSVAHIVRTYAANGTTVLLVSGREARYRKPTERWLEKHAIPYKALHMRPTRDFRKGAIVKTEIYHAHIHGQYEILFVLDDRNQVVGNVARPRAHLPPGRRRRFLGAPLPQHSRLIAASPAS